MTGTTATTAQNDPFSRAKRAFEVGDFKSAEEEYLVLIEIFSQAEKTGENMVSVIQCIDGLSDVYRATGNCEGLIGCDASLTAIYRNIFGESSSEFLQMFESLGYTYYKCGEYAEAEKILLATIKNQSSLDGDSINDLMLRRYTTLSYIYYTQGIHEKSIEYQLLGVETAGVLYGLENPVYADLLLTLGGITYENAKKYDEAEPVLLKALEIFEKTKGKNCKQALDALEELIANYILLTDYGKAMEYAQQILQRYKQVFGESSLEYGRTLTQIGEIYSALGQASFAEKAYRQAMKTKDLSNTERCLLLVKLYDLKSNEENLVKLDSIYQEIGDIIAQDEQIKSSYAFSFLLLRYGLMALKFGDFVASEGAFLQTIENQVDNPDSLGAMVYECSALNNLGLTYSELGDFKRAENAFLNAQKLGENLLLENPYTYVDILVNAGSLYFKKGYVRKAEKTLLRAKDILTKSDQIDDFELRFRQTQQLSHLYFQIGDRRGALEQWSDLFPHLERLDNNNPLRVTTELKFLEAITNAGFYPVALEMNLIGTENHIASRGKNNLEYVRFLMNQVENYRRLKLEESNLNEIKLLEEIIEILDRIDVKDDAIRNNAKYCLADSYTAEGEFGKALSIYEALLENDLSLPILISLGRLHLTMGEFEKAERYYDQATTLFGNFRGYIAISNVALGFQKIGEIGKAASVLDTLQRRLITDLQYSYEFLSSENKLEFKAELVNYESVINSGYYRYHSKLPGISKAYYDLRLSVNNSTLRSETDVLNRFTNLNDTSAVRVFRNWLLANQQVARKVSSSSNWMDDYLDPLKTKARELRKQLMQISEHLVELNGPATWDMVRDVLAEDEATIEFSSFEYVNSNGTLTDSTLYTALILRSGDTCPRMVTLFEQRQLDALTELETDDRQRIALLYRGAVPVAEQMNNYGNELYELVWAPLEEHLQGARKIHFSPSGSLHQISFSALPISEDSLVMDRYELNRVGSTAAITFEREERPPSDIVLFGGMDYSMDTTQLQTLAQNISTKNIRSRGVPADISRGNEEWPDLPGTRQEVEGITRIAQDAGVRTTSYLGEEAIEERYKNLGGKNSPTVLHIATHGFFFPDPEKKQADRRLNGFLEDRPNVYKESDDPMNRSGILFSGANASWTGNEPTTAENGILTAREATYVPLINTELVVLSACETGLGEIKGSEGVFGLQRAFKAAGAEYLLMSLWKVPDQETSEFMESFYGHYLSDHTIPDSYHHAQRVMRNKYPNDPYKWAGFVLMK